MRHTAEELIDILNCQDESPTIEAKGGSDATTSLMETICAFSNEPKLGGGCIVMGVAENFDHSGRNYKVVGVRDSDKLQRDTASQCASLFNIPVRPEMSVESVEGKTVVVIWVPEVDDKQKPIYFKSSGLPSGAMRRIGSTDQHCVEDDLYIFYQNSESYDQTAITGFTLADTDAIAIGRYRSLRANVNPVAEELSYSDQELLEALGCMSRINHLELNLAGLLVFGNSAAQRRAFPMLRVDYIRVPGTVWIQDPENRFTSIDMRGPLILLVFRLIDAINADLPKGFLLGGDNIQATSVGLPLKALREALVNALMHRSYREHRPVQVIRYDNRIEIVNPGFSLKAEERLGQPGSETRNPFIAAIFHETNLAETKGSGVRAMRRLMQSSHLAPPTFESDRNNNQFTVRLLLHHFLNTADLEWLKKFGHLSLSDGQQQALLFVREVGAIDNATYRQMADCDLMRASQDLRVLRSRELLISKGRGRATYYIAGAAMSQLPIAEDLGAITEPRGANTEALGVITEPQGANTEALGVITEPQGANTEALGVITEPQGANTEPQGANTEPQPKFEDLMQELPTNLMTLVKVLKKRENDRNKVTTAIRELCAFRPYRLTELSVLLNRKENHLSRTFIRSMIHSGELFYKYPEMINHPQQAYIAKLQP
jgi:ATP-dependent DNA helicase RecG